MRSCAFIALVALTPACSATGVATSPDAGAVGQAGMGDAGTGVKDGASDASSCGGTPACGPNALPCTWSELCQSFNSPNSAKSCTGGFLAMVFAGTDTGFTAYYSQETGRLVATVSGDHVGNIICTGPADFAPGTCTPNDTLCPAATDAGAD